MPSVARLRSPDGHGTAGGGAGRSGAADYRLAGGTLTWLPGTALVRPVDVTVCGDFAAEGNETLFINLFNPGSAQIADGQGTGTITNDD